MYKEFRSIKPQYIIYFSVKKLCEYMISKDSANYHICWIKPHVLLINFKRRMFDFIVNPLDDEKKNGWKIDQN